MADSIQGITLWRVSEFNQIPTGQIYRRSSILVAGRVEVKLGTKEADPCRVCWAFNPTLCCSSASQIAEHPPNTPRHSAAIGQLRANRQLPPPTCRRERRSTPFSALVGSQPLGVAPADRVRSPLASRPYIPPELACVRASGNGSMLGGFVTFTSGGAFCASACQSKLFANM